MPMHEYDCRKCGAGFEHLSLNARDLPEQCPSCGATKPVKRMSAFQARSKSAAQSSCASSGSCPGAGGRSCASGACPFSA